MSPAPTHPLAAREQRNPRRVALPPGSDELTVSVEDARVGHRFELAVAPARALDAFNHPFAYAA